jgi:hypothetical protein
MGSGGTVLERYVSAEKQYAAGCEVGGCPYVVVMAWSLKGRGDATTRSEIAGYFARAGDFDSARICGRRLISSRPYATATVHVQSP